MAFLRFYARTISVGRSGAHYHSRRAVHGSAFNAVSVWTFGQ
jgi:hypothetical protein